MDDYIKDKIVRLSKIYRINKDILEIYEEEYSDKKVLSKEDIISSISITSKMEFEDDMTLHLTKNVLSRYEEGNLEFNSENNVNKRILNVFNAYLELNKVINKPMSLEILTKLHSKLLSGFSKFAPGVIRPTEVYIGDGSLMHTFVLAKLVPEQLNTFIRNYNKLRLEQTNIEILKNICDLKRDFIRIHPFKDGNGRTSRMIFQKLLIENNLPLTTFDNWIREDYHDIMELAVETGRVNLLVDFYLYNLYNKINVYEGNKVIINDRYNKKHEALLTNRPGIFKSLRIDQLVYGELVSKDMHKGKVINVHKNFKGLVKIKVIRNTLVLKFNNLIIFISNDKILECIYGVIEHSERYANVEIIHYLDKTLSIFIDNLYVEISNFNFNNDYKEFKI